MDLKEYTFEQIMDGFFDGPHATPAPSDSGLVFLGIKNIQEQGGLDLSDIRHISEQEFPKWTKRVTPCEGDIVFSYEATLHRYAIIPKGFQGCLGRRMALIRLNPQKADNNFLYYYFLSPCWKAFIDTNKISGATVDRISIIHFPKYKIGLPELSVQKNIVSIISGYDEHIDNNNQRIALLEQTAEEIYKEWFVRLRFPGYIYAPIVGSIPDGWANLPLSEVFEILSGGTPKTENSDFWNGDIPFFSPKDSHGELYCFDTENHITEKGLSSCNSRLFPKESIIITARGTVGNVVLTGVPMAMNQSCFALKPKMAGTDCYSYQLIKNTVAILKQIANGATFDAITIRTFEQTKAVVPSIEKRLEYESIVSPMFEQIKTLIQKNRLLKQTRDLLLPRLISGKLIVEHLLDDQ